MSSRLRASDREREETVALLGRAAAEGRLDLDELETRVSRAYAATTRAGLIRLLEDLPQAQLRPQGDARAQWSALLPATQAAAELVAYVGRVLHTHGYALQSRGADRVVFSRRRRRAWLQPARFVLPLRLLARLRKLETVTFELQDYGTATTIIVSGQAPPEVWRALAELEG